MKDHNPHDPLNMIGEAYEGLLEETMHSLHIIDGKNKTDNPHTIHRIDNSKKEPTLNPSEQTLQHNLNREIIKLSLLNSLKRIADKTTLSLTQFQKLKRLPDEFNRGDLVDIGTLYCDHCGEPTEITFPSHLEKCKNCGYTTFTKLH